MSLDTILTIITTVGFPIAAVIGCAFFIARMSKTYREDLTEQLEVQQAKADEREEKLYGQLNEFNKSLQGFNNTLVKIDTRLELLEKYYIDKIPQK